MARVQELLIVDIEVSFLSKLVVLVDSSDHLILRRRQFTTHKFANEFSLVELLFTSEFSLVFVITTDLTLVEVICNSVEWMDSFSLCLKVVFETRCHRLHLLFVRDESAVSLWLVLF